MAASQIHLEIKILKIMLLNKKNGTLSITRRKRKS